MNGSVLSPFDLEGRGLVTPTSCGRRFGQGSLGLDFL